MFFSEVWLFHAEVQDFQRFRLWVSAQTNPVLVLICSLGLSDEKPAASRAVYWISSSELHGKYSRVAMMTGTCQRHRSLTHLPVKCFWCRNIYQNQQTWFSCLEASLCDVTWRLLNSDTSGTSVSIKWCHTIQSPCDVIWRRQSWGHSSLVRRSLHIYYVRKTNQHIQFLFSDTKWFSLVVRVGRWMFKADLQTTGHTAAFDQATSSGLSGPGFRISENERWQMSVRKHLHTFHEGSRVSWLTITEPRVTRDWP